MADKYTTSTGKAVPMAFIASVVATLYKKFLKSKGVEKSKDFVDGQEGKTSKFLTSDNKLKVTAVRPALSNKAKEEIANLYDRKSKATNTTQGENVANDIITNDNRKVFETLTNIFTPSFFAVETPVPVEPKKKKKKKAPKIEEEEEPEIVPTPTPAGEETEIVPTPTPALASQMAERKEEEQKELNALGDFQQLAVADRVFAPMPLPIRTRPKQRVPTREEMKAQEDQRKLLYGLNQKLIGLSDDVKKTTEEIKGARSNMTAYAETSQEIGDQILIGVEDIKAETKEIKMNTAEIMNQIRQDPRLNQIRDAIERKILYIPTTPNNGLQGILTDADIKVLIQAIPDPSNRQFLAPAVSGLLGKDLKMNDIVSGLVGLAVAGIASPTAGAIAERITNQVMKKYDINLDELIRVEIALDEAESFLSGSDESGSDEEKKEERKIDRLYKYARRIRPPTRDTINAGTGAGAMMSAITAGLTTGRFGGAVSGIVPGAIGGAMAAAITAPMIEAYYRDRGTFISEETRKKIEYISLLPPALIGAYLGYTPPGSEVRGTGVVSGAGITERRLIAPPDTVQQTQVQESQQGSSNKIWQPKSIFPTTDILNESNQEKYADQVEFIAFNYIAPTSEGANGTVETNPLKRSQATADALRFTDSGVYVPFLLWNQVNNTNDMKPSQLDKLALGVELPPMEFMAQDNEETFEEVARLQYPNNELMAIEFLSPYADFSNVENFWMTNPDNMLFTINA